MKDRIYQSIQVITGILLVGFVSFSCEGFLNEVPGENITPEQHYNNELDAEISILGAFTTLQEVVPNLIVLNELRSDLLVETDNFDPDIREINQHNISINNRFNDPSGYYRVIINVNEVLAHIQSIQEVDQDYDDLEYFLDYVELISLRSWAYFTLVRLYGEAAYIPDNLSSFSEDHEFEYYSKNEMIDLLLAELDDTITYPDVYVGGNTLGIYDRILRGEMYLEKGNYTKAAEHLENAIGDADIISYKMSVYLRETWREMFINSMTHPREVMTAVPFSYEDNQENPLADIFYFDRNYLVKPSDPLIELYERQITKKDEHGDVHRGNRVSYIRYTADSLLAVNKYSMDPIVESSGSDIIIYRAAHAHLLLAEAYNRMGYYDRAMNILNDGLKILPGWRNANGVRGRVHLKAKVTPGADIMNTIEDMIMEERAMELAFEGQRWFDLVRVANRRGEAYLADKVAAKYDDPAVRAAVRNTLMDKSNWYLPFRK